MDDPSRVVLVDMDGVLADFDRYVVDAIGAVCPQLRSAGTRSEFRLTDAFPEHRARIEAVTSRQEFFASLPLCESAVEGWERIGAARFRPRVGSTPLLAKPRSARAKRAGGTPPIGARVAPEARG
ncbi:hypothetical protein, partial [Streptomyces sp. NPDC005485]|uniref:hypothetical protein n=1 Tax=Streptomyces sp. NPDC005485 TaxID=3155591 RepID=UPI0033AFDDC7